MSGYRSFSMGLVFLAALMLILVVVAIVLSFAQQAPGNPSGNDITSLPISLVLDNAMNQQMQDIQERIFEYKFQAASNDPTSQEALVNTRGQELANEAANNERFVNSLLSNNVSLKGNQLAALADAMNISTARINNMSLDLQHRSAGLPLTDNGIEGNSNFVMPLVGEINNTIALDQKMSQAAISKMADNVSGHFNGPLKNNGDNIKNK
jgi:hypothetical protein